MTLKNKVVHCSTYEIANKILALAVHEDIIKIIEAGRLLNAWQIHKENTCYDFRIQPIRTINHAQLDPMIIINGNIYCEQCHIHQELNTDLEKKLGIKTNTVIWCYSKEIAREVLEICYDLGLNKNKNGIQILSQHLWDVYGVDTCYNLFTPAYGSKKWYKDRNYNIIYASTFLEIHEKINRDAAIKKIFKETDNFMGISKKFKVPMPPLMSIWHDIAMSIEQKDNFQIKITKKDMPEPNKKKPTKKQLDKEFLAKIIARSTKVFITKNLTIKKKIKDNKIPVQLERKVTVCVMMDKDSMYLHAGYSVLNPMVYPNGKADEFNPELAKEIAMGRALQNNTNILNGKMLSTNYEIKPLLKTIAKDLLHKIEQGIIVIPGIK